MKKHCFVQRIEIRIRLDILVKMSATLIPVISVPTYSLSNSLVFYLMVKCGKIY